MVEINFWAVVVAAIASMVIGSLWYGPLFGGMFSRAMGFDKMSPEQRAAMGKGMTWLYVGQFIASLVMFYFLAYLVNNIYSDLRGAINVGLVVWIGFMVTTHFGNAIWGGKMKLFWLAAGNSLVTVLVGSIIIGLWK